MIRGSGREVVTVLLVSSLAACAPAAPEPAAAGAAGPVTAVRVAATEGFSGPESVRYDPQGDVYFVSNFNGNPNEPKNNGFISRVRPDGTVDRLRFIAGGVDGVTLHAPRGMTIVGDTLWVADLGAVRGFDRRTGAAVATVDFSGLDTGFLNDVTPGPAGGLYVTDTGRNRVYRIQGRTPTVALEDTVLNRPNGITWDRAGDRFILAPFGGKQALLGWHPARPGLQVIATGPGGAYDGVEVLDPGRVLVGSQADSSLHLFVEGQVRASLRTEGRPADIGVDTRRGRVAVPFVALNRVDFYDIPRGWRR